MYPMKMRPIYKDYLWGGTRLNKRFNKNSNFLNTAESWELSCCLDGLSVIDNGDFKNKTLFDVLQKNVDFISSNFEAGLKFPLLIKLIDANDRLSIQVHPSDELADKSKDQQGKAEMWYILDCKEDAFLYLGFKDNIPEKLLKTKILSGEICDCLNKVFVKQGDVFFISPGLVHAIGEGILIAEIQQSSNTTFRMFDYDRKDAKGQKRQLHIDEAIRVCDKTKYDLSRNQSQNSSEIAEIRKDFEKQKLVDCQYFKVVKYTSKHNIEFNCKNNSFQALLFIDGNGKIIFNDNTYEFNKGDCYFIPAGMGCYRVDGNFEVLVSSM